MNPLDKVIQIVPQLPPAIDGVGDYALNLARQMQQDFGVETLFVICQPNWNGTSAIEKFPVKQVPVQSAQCLIDLLNSDLECHSASGNLSTPSKPTNAILLHYANYGYAKRGCPIWLVNALKSWKRGMANSILVTMFHEVYAYGFPPWNSSFWLSPLQKSLAKRLIQLSDSCFTSGSIYASILHKLSQRESPHIFTLPIFSNVGEPEPVLPLAKRARKIVIFGSSNRRRKLYQNFSTELNHACQLLKIEEIVDLGLPTGLHLSMIDGVSVFEAGYCSTSEVSEFLANAIAGFFDYLPGYLSKSGIFAAYCAHGILPISPRYNPSDLDGLKLGKHYWIPTEQFTGLDLMKELQIIVDNALAWYQTHKLSIQAQIFAKQLSQRVETQVNMNN